MKKEEVLKKKEEYETAREQFHQENNTTIRIRPEPDQYRGDYSCIEFIDAVESKWLEGQGCPDQFEVFKNGVPIGILKRWYGSGGQGKLAAEEFHPYEGVKVL